MALEVQEGKCLYCAEPFESVRKISDTAEIVQIIPFPAVDLTTGEEYEAEKPFWAIRVIWATQGYDNEEDFIPIQYCPMCGRKLEVTKEMKMERIFNLGFGHSESIAADMIKEYSDNV